MLLDQRRISADDVRHRPARAFADALPAKLQRLFRRAEAPPADDLPPELAFLVAQGVAPELLRRASRIAEEAGVPGEAALFGLGFSDERYGRLLARHLGAKWLTDPLPLARDRVNRVGCSAAGAAPLAPNPANLRHVLAPHGAPLRALLRDHRFDDLGRYDVAITTRRRLDALLRRHDRAGLGRCAASGLADWDATLSARGGATLRQKRTALAFMAAAAFASTGAPGAAGLALSLVLLVVFAAAVTQRLLVVGASPKPLPVPPAERRPDRDLPVYTLIVPLFREARVLPQLVRNLDALDYPVLGSKLT